MLSLCPLYVYKILTMSTEVIHDEIWSRELLSLNFSFTHCTSCSCNSLLSCFKLYFNCHTLLISCFNVVLSSCRDVELTERLDYSSAVALLGFSLIVAILRAFRVRTKSSRVMTSAPLAILIMAHIFYLNSYAVDYGNKFHSLHIFYSMLPFLFHIYGHGA